MTKQLDRYAHAALAHLRGVAWPISQPVAPATRIWMDTWSALWTWDRAGRHVYRVRPEERRSIAADLHLETALIAREGQAYSLDRDQWIVVARLHEGMGVPISRERTVGSRQPLLVYCTEIEGHLAAGYISLADQPTPRDLRLSAGTFVRELYNVELEQADVLTDHLRLARVLPLFFLPP